MTTFCSRCGREIPEGEVCGGDGMEAECVRPELRLFSCTKFTGVWPVGVSAIVYAESQHCASDLLNASLRARSLPGDAEPKHMTPIVTVGQSPFVTILQDGDY